MTTLALPTAPTPAGVARWLVGSLALGLAVIAAALASLSYGQVSIPIGEVIAGLLDSSADSTSALILRDLRLPRVGTALVAGAALGIAGVLMQALLRNPVADAWSLGLLAGGQLGVALTVAGAAFAGPAALAFLEVFQGVSLTVGAAVGVAVAAVAVLWLGRRVGAVTLLVVGLMLSFTVQGIVSVVVHFVSRAGGKVFSGWNDGNFASVLPAEWPLLAGVVLVGIVLAGACAKPLNSLLLGETYAKSLGTNVGRLRTLALAATVLLVAPVTAFCGPITFIGLIVPHVARAIAKTARIGSLLPLAALAGALLAVLADFVVHLPWQQHFLHLNAVLALVGAPVVIALLVFSPVMRGLR
ncbi:MAG: iron chelate uptake ABC transporter family permease subunit [Bacteroidota bacterium]